MPNSGEEQVVTTGLCTAVLGESKALGEDAYVIRAVWVMLGVLLSFGSCHCILVALPVKQGYLSLQGVISTWQYCDKLLGG